MSSAPLHCLEPIPCENAVATVLWLHGLGDAGGFVDFPAELQLPADRPLRWIFPQAPNVPVTLNNGFVMPAWYNVTGLTLEDRHDVEMIRANAALLTDVIDREVARGMPAERIFLGGFSMGGAMSIFTGLRYPKALAGIVGFSCYGLIAETLETEATAASRGTPIFQAHGTRDTVVQHSWATTTRDQLQAAGYEVEWHDYPMEHSLCLEQVLDFRAWMTARLEPFAEPPA